MKPPLSSRRRIGRAIRLLATIAVALTLLYTGVLNTVLLSPLLRAVANRQGRALHLEYTRAYFVLPDRVHVDGLRLRGGDTHVEWLVAVDHCTFGLRLLPLLHRQFHASYVNADGVSVRARLLVSEAIAAHDDFVPPIPGFVSPALKPVGPPSPPITDANYNLVTVDLENVDARHVREIWVDTARFAGDFRVRGRWIFRPVRYLEIGPAVVDVASLDVSHGLETPLVTGAHGGITASVEGFDVRGPKLRETVRYMTLRTNLAGVLEGAEAVRSFWPEWPGTIDLRGDLGVYAIVDHGVLQPGSGVTLEAPAASVRTSGWSVGGGLNAYGHVDRTAGASLATLDTVLRDVDLRGEPVVGARADQVSLSVSSRDVDLESPFRRGNYDATVAGKAARIRLLGAPLPAGLTVHTDAVTVDGHLHGALPELTASGDVHATVSGLVALGRSIEVHADADAAMHLRSEPAIDGLDFGGSHVDVSRMSGLAGGVRFGASHLATSASSLEVSPANGRARGDLLAAARGAMVGLPYAELRGDVAVRVARFRVAWRDEVLASMSGAEVSTPGLSLRAYPDPSSAEIASAGALVVWSDALDLHSGHPSGKLSFNLPVVRLPRLRELSRWISWPNDLAVNGGAALGNARMEADVASGGLTGKVHLAATGVEVRLASEKYGGDATLDVTAREAGGGGTDLRGTTVLLEHVQGTHASDWWAKATVYGGVVAHAPSGWAGRLQLHLGASNATPATGIVATEVGVPRWVVGILSLPHLEGDGEVSFGPGTFEVRNVVVRGETSWIRLEVAQREGVTRGLLLLKQGLLEAGFGLGQETPKFLLFGGEQWFASRKLTLESSQRLP